MTLAFTLLMLAGCGQPPPPAGMVRVEGGSVIPWPGAASVELAPFVVDRTLAMEAGRPVRGLSWDHASARCAERGLRLPTDAEWLRMVQAQEPPEDLTGVLFQWTSTPYSTPDGAPTAPEMRGERRVVRGACCPFVPAWSAPEHRAAYPRDRDSHWIGYRCAGPVGAEDPNLAIDGRPALPSTALDEGEAVRQLLAGLHGPDRAPTDPDVRSLIETLEPGAAVADIGCGLGALALELHHAVGPEGQVFAVDVNPEVLAFTDTLAQSRDASSVRTVLAQPDDPALAPACCDLVLLYDMANSLRSEDLPGFTAGLARAVRPGGRLAVFHLPGTPPPTSVLEALAAHSLELKRTVVDPSSSPMDPERQAAKLWIFVKP